MIAYAQRPDDDGDDEGLLHVLLQQHVSLTHLPRRLQVCLDAEIVALRHHCIGQPVRSPLAGVPSTATAAAAAAAKVAAAVAASSSANRWEENAAKVQPQPQESDGGHQKYCCQQKTTSAAQDHLIIREVMPSIRRRFGLTACTLAQQEQILSQIQSSRTRAQLFRLPIGMAVQRFAQSEQEEILAGDQCCGIVSGASIIPQFDSLLSNMLTRRQFPG